MQIENAGNAMANEENHSTCNFLGDIYQPLISFEILHNLNFLLRTANP